MKKISVKGIIVGVIVGFLVMISLEVPLVLYVKNVLMRRGVSEHSVSAVIQGEILMTPLLLAFRLLSGWIASVAGGYFAARVSKSNLLLNATLSTIVRFLFGLYSVPNIFGSIPVALLVLSDLGSPVFGFVGGYLRLKECQKKRTLTGLTS